MIGFSHAITPVAFFPKSKVYSTGKRVRIFPMFGTVAQDLIYAVRQLRRNRGFTATVVLTLALGIGATTAIFSLVDGILLRPLPYPEARRLVALSTLEFPPGVTDVRAADMLGNSYPNYFDWQAQSHSFESLASCQPVTRLFSKMDGSGARVMDGARISASLFPTLRVLPALGRNFISEEELPGHRVVILSHELWVSDFASSPSVIGQSLKLSDEPSTIVGVMPSGFHFPVGKPARFWATFAADTEGKFPVTESRGEDLISVVGRLKQGVSDEQADAELKTIQRSLAQLYSENRNRFAVSVDPLLDLTVAGAREALLLLLAAVAVVLLIGCTNVAGLLLARANGRKSEVALRAALGASRSRVLRQLLLESLLLASLGGAAGILAAWVLLRSCLRFLPSDLPRTYGVVLDGRVLAFAIFLSVATTLLFGLLPALRVSRLDPAEALRDGGPTVTAGRRSHHLHHSLVVGEMALGFTLLVGSGLLIHSMIKLFAVPPGFDLKHTVAFDVALTQKRFPDAAKVVFYDKLLPKLAVIPGVEVASGVQPLPMVWPWSYEVNFTVAGHLNSPDQLPAAVGAVAEPRYFEALSIPLLRGRTFTEHDNNAKSPPVAVINRSLAQKYFPGEDPIGRYFTPRFTETSEPLLGRQIVGIVGNTRSDDYGTPYSPEFFLPYAQNATHQRAHIVLKVAGNPSGYEETVRKVVADLDKDVPIFEYHPFEFELARANAQPRFEAWVVSVFAGISLFLSAVGLYAVLSFVVTERTRELGVRMALGAQRSDVLKIVLRRGLVLATAGTALGAVVSFFASRLLGNILFDATPLDHWVFLSVTITLFLVSMAASLVPALRAARLDPMRTLREQ